MPALEAALPGVILTCATAAEIITAESTIDSKISVKRMNVPQAGISAHMRAD